jgi:hypothetical protein
VTSREKQHVRLLFIIGTGRCGSTMVQEALARHRDVGFISNFDSRWPGLNLKGRWNNSLYRLTPRRYIQRDRRRLLRGGDPEENHFGPSEAYRIINDKVSPIVGAPYRDLTADDVTPWLEHRFRAFFQERMDVQKKPVFMHKFTGWPRASFIHRIFPEAQFLHVIRDGRAVASSLLERKWWRGYKGPPEWGFGPLTSEFAEQWESSGRSFVVLAGLEWRLLMDAAGAAKKSIPSNLWMDIRYEDFVSDPRERLKAILEFIGLEWTDQFDAKFKKFAFTGDRTRRHLDKLTAEQARALESVLQGHLRYLGYEWTDSPAEKEPTMRNTEATAGPQVDVR